MKMHAARPAPKPTATPTPRGLPVLVAWPVWAVLVSFVVLGFWFTRTIPPFETPDEHYHYAFARHLAQGNDLPVQAATPTGPWQQEGSQAPLYYWLVGGMTAAIDQTDFEALAVLNPRANLGDPLFPGNKNRMLYSAVDHPLVGANLALHIGRWFSVVLGVVTLGSLYAIARLLWPRPSPYPLVALAIGAWLPQFVFLSASFTNDTLVIALAALTLYRLAHLVTKYGAPPSRKTTQADMPRATSGASSEATGAIPWWEWALIGLLLGAAALSKLQGLGLWLLAALTGGVLAWRQRDWQVLLRAALPVAVPALAIAGWWYWRNIALYGDWTGLSHLAAITGERSAPLTWAGWWREFRGLRYSSWGLFGWFNLLLPLWAYTVLDALTLVAVGGGLAGLWARWTGRADRKATRPVGSPGLIWAVLWLWTLISAGALIYWIIRAEGSQGRLLFPALPALVILLTAGLATTGQGLGKWVGRFRPDKWPARLAVGIPALAPLVLLVWTLYSGAWLLPQAYAAPSPRAEISAHASPVDFRYGPQQALHILAMEVAPGRYVPGNTVDVTLYMSLGVDPSPFAPGLDAPDDYQLFIQFLDETGAEVGNLTTHPGWGSNPTSLWQPGAIYADTYPVRFAQAIDTDSPLLARIYVGFVNPATEDSGRFPVVAYNAQGEIVDPTIAGHVVLHPLHPPLAEGMEPLGAEFGNEVALVAASVTPASDRHALDIELLWQATAPPHTDLVAFVHLLAPDGDWLAGHDAEPAPRFPTRHWQPGDRILSRWQLALPDEQALGPDDDEGWELWVGLYPGVEMGAVRTPITDDGGLSVRHEMLKIWPPPTARAD